MRIGNDVLNLKDYIESFDPDNYMVCLKLKKDLISAIEKITDGNIKTLFIIADYKSDRMSLAFIFIENGEEHMGFVDNDTYLFHLDADEVEYIIDNIFI